MNNTNAAALAALNTLIEEKTELEQKVADLVAYLTSSKFQQDRNVNVTDVLTRLGAF